MTETETIAFHEAEQVVAMPTLGSAIGRASLRPPKVTYAVSRTWPGRFDTDLERAAGRRFALVALCVRAGG
jgi:hypothetical protein